MIELILIGLLGWCAPAIGVGTVRVMEKLIEPPKTPKTPKKK
jgi:hypothetical protein